MDLVSVPRLAQVHPKLQALVKQMDVQLESRGIVFRIVQGLRTWAQQQALYDQGRKTSGQVVTDAPPGYSYHEYGTAVDLIPGLRGKDMWAPNWEPTSPDFQLMIKTGIDLGLVSGFTWVHIKDYPHFQLGGGLPDSPTEEMRDCLEKNGLTAFWEQYVK